MIPQSHRLLLDEASLQTGVSFRPSLLSVFEDPLVSRRQLFSYNMARRGRNTFRGWCSHPSAYFIDRLLPLHRLPRDACRSLNGHGPSIPCFTSPSMLDRYSIYSIIGAFPNAAHDVLLSMTGNSLICQYCSCVIPGTFAYPVVPGESTLADLSYTSMPFSCSSRILSAQLLAFPAHARETAPPPDRNECMQKPWLSFAATEWRLSRTIISEAVRNEDPLTVVVCGNRKPEPCPILRSFSPLFSVLPPGSDTSSSEPLRTES